MELAFVCDQEHPIEINALIKEGYDENDLLDASVYEIEDHPVEISFAAGIVMNEEGEMPDLILIPDDTKNAKELAKALSPTTKVQVFRNE